MKLITALLVAALGSPVLGAHAAAPLPGDFVFLRDVDPTIIQDIRYATANNFVGRRLRGYDAGECIVTRNVATALKRVQQNLKPQGLSLKMYDCYRPQRAVDDMYAWAQDGHETPSQHLYNPKMRKEDLFRLGYIAKHSGHSTGKAVDLTLVKLPAAPSAPFDPQAAYADCTAPANLRAPDSSVDMGAGYDCSDEKAHTNSKAISPQQRKWRDTLVSAMAKQGFVNYRLEWWHFSLAGGGNTAFDFPVVRPR
ncbi:M15 family metallopeptidase [Bradyrhizobium sp. SYSU BS000235]|uniref:M15 family metallopeptidase n=1 Tax=Bradyrhizobium sp. SYSU BS000235 TaxID=3411332 RepID=UPI003C754FD4